MYTFKFHLFSMILYCNVLLLSKTIRFLIHTYYKLQKKLTKNITIQNQCIIINHYMHINTQYLSYLYCIHNIYSIYNIIYSKSVSLLQPVNNLSLVPHNQSAMSYCIRTANRFRYLSMRLKRHYTTYVSTTVLTNKCYFTNPSSRCSYIFLMSDFYMFIYTFYIQSPNHCERCFNKCLFVSLITAVKRMQLTVPILTYIYNG